jgi:hypothetical protein
MHDDVPMSSFNNYFWSKQDVIGAGATSIVYKAICSVSLAVFQLIFQYFSNRHQFCTIL